MLRTAFAPGLRTVSAAAVVLLATASVARADAPFDARAYLDEAIAVVRTKALFADRVDWSRLSAELHRKGDGAATAFDTYPLLVDLLRALDDRHSFLQLSAARAEAYTAAKGQAFVYPPDPAASPRRTLDRRFVGRSGPAPVDDLVDGKRIRSVVVTGTDSNAPEALQTYAAAMNQALAAGPRACGYIVDLRGNTGGNMAPMIAGLGVLLGDGPVGGYVGREGAGGGESWVVRGDRLMLRSGAGEQVLLRVPGWTALPGAATAPVAVLIDGGTASSGEITAIAFAGRKRTVRFGAASYGVSTATSGFALSDGANLVIVDSLVRDRTGRRYPDGVTPDHATDPAAAPAAAKRWLAERCRR